MTPDFIKERIKLETETLRLYFVLFLADVSGSIALIGKPQSMDAMINIILIILGFTFACILAIVMYKTKNKISNLINHLNP